MVNDVWTCRPLKRLRVFPVGLRDHSGDFFWSEEGTPFLPWRSCIGHVDTARGRGDHAGCWGAHACWWVNSRAGNGLPKRFFFLERERYRKGEEGSFHGGRDRDSELGGKKFFYWSGRKRKYRKLSKHCLRSSGMANMDFFVLDLLHLPSLLLLWFWYSWFWSHSLEFCLSMNCLCCSFLIKCLNHAWVLV